MQAKSLEPLPNPQGSPTNREYLAYFYMVDETQAFIQEIDSMREVFMEEYDVLTQYEGIASNTRQSLKTDRPLNPYKFTTSTQLTHRRKKLDRLHDKAEKLINQVRVHVAGNY